MALPKINNTPKYSINIPSTGKQVRFRPYLVKEEKVLMMAMESQDQNQILNAIADTIIACVEEPLSRNALTSFDVEYMFIQIRSKSVGETIDLEVECKECKSKNPIKVKLDKIKVDVPKVNNNIKITEEISVTMKWPSFSTLINLDASEDDGKMSTQIFKIILSCIHSVNTEDEKIILADEPYSEQMDFIESLDSLQFNKIKNYVQSIPKLQHDVSFDCKGCGTHNERKLEGIIDFFQ